VRTTFPAVAVGLVAAVLVPVVAGCGPTPGGSPTTIAAPTGSPARPAGGACYLLDFADIEQTLGVRFDIAAASRSKDTYTCVVRPALTDQPDLSLSVTATTADVSVFKDTVTPDGASGVTGLGKVGYRTTLAAGAGKGPAVEVGWLSGDGRLLTLRFTLAAGQATGATQAVVPKVVALARKIDLSRV
jgi:hypothetical protein